MVRFLETLPPKARSDVEAHARVKHFKREEPLFLAGDEPSCAYAIQHGIVKLTHDDAQGRDTILALCFSGRVVGAGALLLDETHTHAARGASTGSASAIPRDLFERVLAADARTARAFAEEQARWVRTFEASTNERTSKVAARVAGRLLDLADAIGTDGEKGRYVRLPMPYADLARCTATSRETVSKTLHRFRREGLIDFRGRTMRIERPDMLQRIRCGARASELFR